MWSAWDCFLTGARDVLGLQREPHAYKSWESAAKLGGFRVMHSKFCMVCDFPDVLKVDSESRPHCEDGPSHRWSDGWSIWHINGVVVDEQIIMHPETQTIKQIDSEQNQDVRSIRIERYGWDNYLRDSKAKCIDHRDNEIEGTKEALYQTKHGDKRLVATCATGRVFAIGVPAEIKDCEAAQEWLAGGKKFRLVART